MTTRRPFGPVERATIAEKVRDDILGRIASGELRPGTPLPAERVLADQFGVARTSIREAVQGLSAVGAIERHGNRSYIAQRVPGAELPASDGRPRSLRMLLEARQVLELTLFELAAFRATARERNEVMALALTPAPTTVDDFARADREFHAAIAAACGNAALLEVYGRVLDTLAGTEVSASLVLGIGPDDDPVEAITRGATEHRRIAEAFVGGDIEVMLEAVERHLGSVAGRVSRVGVSGRTPSATVPTTRRTVGM